MLKGLCGGIFGFAIMFGIGGIFVAVSLPDFEDYFTSDTWEKTSGVVTVSEVVESADSDGDTTYRADVQYRFLVNEQEYFGDRVRFGGNISTSNSSNARQTVAEYPVGREIQVIYDPNDPHQNVLEREVAMELWLFGGIGAALMCLAFPLLGIFALGSLRGR
ncbi:MAG: DUF3592 domain-containing protein [Anaerolineales bacterium]